MELVVVSYALAKRLPKIEMYGLANQVRRAAISVPANIAEGHGREHRGEYLHHVSFANGSLMELETEIIAAGRLGYVTDADVSPVLTMTAELGRMLAGLLRSLRKKPLAPDP